MPDIPLQFADAGNALMQGSHAGYYTGRSRREASEEERRAEAAVHIPGALSGDPDAMRQVAAIDPRMAEHVAKVWTTLDEPKKAALKEAADFTVQMGGAIMGAPAADRQRLYEMAKQQAQGKGWDTTKWPVGYDPGWLTYQMKFGIPAQKLHAEEEMMRRKVTRAPGAGVGEEETEVLGVRPDGTIAPLPGAQPPAARPGMPGRRAEFPGTPGQGVPMPSIAQAPSAPNAPPPISVAQFPQGAVAPAERAPFAPAGGQIEQGSNPYAMPGGQMGDPNIVPAQAPMQRPVTGPAVARPPAPSAPPGAPRDDLSGLPPIPAPPAGQPLPGSSMHPRDPMQDGFIQLYERPKGSTGPGVPRAVQGGYWQYINPQTGQTVLWKPKPEAPTERTLPPVGYQPNPNGAGVVPIPGGPADPDHIERLTAARRTEQEKAIPSTVSHGIQGNLDALKQIDRTVSELRRVPDSVGGPGSVAASILPGVGNLQNRIDKEGTGLRALIADIGSLKLHDRSGAAVTASEFPRLRPFIPTIADDPQTVETKLKNFRAIYEQQIRDTTEYYGPDNGFKPYTPALRYLEETEKPQPGASPSAAPRPAQNEGAREELLFQARKALQEGRDPAGVRAVLKQQGVDPALLDAK